MYQFNLQPTTQSKPNTIPTPTRSTAPIPLSPPPHVTTLTGTTPSTSSAPSSSSPALHPHHTQHSSPPYPPDDKSTPATPTPTPLQLRLYPPRATAKTPLPSLSRPHNPTLRHQRRGTHHAIAAHHDRTLRHDVRVRMSMMKQAQARGERGRGRRSRGERDGARGKLRGKLRGWGVSAGARVRDAFCGDEGGRMGKAAEWDVWVDAVGGGGALERGQGVRRVWPWLWLCRVGMLVLVDSQRPTRALL